MAGKAVFRDLPVDGIEIDVKNPRIALIVEMYGEKLSPEQMYLAVGSGDSLAGEGGGSTATFHSLKESIKTNNGIIHPIIVNMLLKDKNKYVVIEGNTRVLIYREFKDQKVKGNWETIPAMVYDNLDQKQIDAIRLQAHLVGPRPWNPYSKAKYLYHLSTAENLTFSQICDFCGGKKQEVVNLIEAYKDMEKYYRKVIQDDSQFDVTRFSAFVEVQKPTIKGSIFKAGFTLEDFAKWVDERLIDPLSTVRKLPQILINEKSRKIFLSKGAEEAIKELFIPDKIDFSQVTLEQIVRAVYQRLTQIKFAEIKELRSNPQGEKAQVLFDLRDELVATCNEIVPEE